MADDRLAEIKFRLKRAHEEQRFYGPYSALEDIDWLVKEVEYFREVTWAPEPAVYQDNQGRKLYCPECGANSPDGYPYEVLHDGRPDPDA